MVLSICDWGNRAPGTGRRAWRDVAHQQRHHLLRRAVDLDRVLANFDTAQHPSAQSPGHYNDPDMLIVGMPGFNLAQNRTHMGLWAISGAPLLAGNNSPR